MLLLAAPQAARRTRGPSGPGFTLAAAVLGFFVITLDAVVVNVALPSIRGDLGGGVTGLQWGGARRGGAARPFAAGLSLFVAASAACGLAPSLGALVAARFVQGAAAAVLLPSSIAPLPQTN